jgi:2'-5' RNA ligase
VDEGRIPDAEQALGGVGASTGPFPLRLSRGGRFGRAAWSAIGGDTVALAAFQHEVRGSLTAAGFASQDRPFIPHLTVSYAADAAIDGSLAAHDGKPWPVTRFTLVHSQAGSYIPLHEWPLTATP